jgi:cytochrome oxidase Cu insertion factor (SCO1/SenC/PrrC family)
MDPVGFATIQGGEMMQRHLGKRLPSRFGFLLMIGVLSAISAGSAAAAGNAGSIWGADYFPNVLLTTHEGKQVRFFDDLIKGKVVVINFLYTSCPDVCPLETARLREVQELLGDRVGRDVFMYSISIDPDRDTPEVLKRYAERFEVGPGWLFLTGKEADIKQLRRKLGLYSESSDGGKLEAHSVSSIIGNQSTGRWMKMSPFENPHIMATQVGSWLSNWKMPGKKEQDYAKAPKLRNVSKGESLFRTRCEACHSIGGGAGMVKSEKRSLGPDLSGVTAKRDRKWLTRWLAEPDKLIAEKDPLVMSMLAEYDNVVMPNFRLNDAEIKAVLAYIEEETLRQGQPHDKMHHHH